MADQNQSVIIKINIDEGTYKKKITDLQKDIINTKKQEQELAKAIKTSGSATDEQITQQIELKNQIKSLTTEQRMYQAGLDSKAKAEAAAAGSMVQMKEVMKQLKREYQELTKEERETPYGQQLQKNIKGLSDELKDLETAYGQTGRNVGNYTESILKAVDGQGLLATITAKAKGAQEAYTATLNITKASLAGNVTGLKALKLALAATGIGAVVLLLGGLVSWLTRTQEGIDFVNQKTKGLTTVIAFLTDKLSAAGKATIDWFNGIQNLGDFFTKLGGEILENVITRLKGFAVVLQAIQERDFAKLQDGVAQVGLGITDATAKTKAFAKEMNEVRKSAEAIEREYQRIEKAEISLSEEREKSNALIAQSRLIAEDITKTEAVRIAAARQADAELSRITEKQLALQRDKVANIAAEQALTNNLNDDNRKLAEEKAKLYQIETQEATRSIELQNKLNSIQKEGQAKRLAATQKQLAAEAELLGIRAESAQNAEEDVLALRIAILKKKAEAELLAENLTAQEVLVIRERTQAEEAKLRSEFRAEQRKEELEEIERTSKAALEVTRKALTRGNEQQDLLLKQQRAQGLIGEREYQEQLQNLKVQRLQNELMALQQYEGKIVGVDELIAAKKLEISNLISDRQIANIDRVETKEEERQQAIRDRQAENLQLMGDVMSTITTQLGEALVTQGNTLEEFSANVVLLAIDTISQILEAQVAASVGAATVQSIASPQSIATAGVAGVAQALALVALIRGAAIAAKTVIKNSISKPDVFAAGGFTGSGAGSPDRTGFKVAGVVHENEWVAPKWMVENPAYRDYIAGLEVIRQRGFAGGGYVTGNSKPLFPASIPAPTREFLAGQAGLTIDYDKLGKAVGKYVPRYIKTTDIKTGLAGDARTAGLANQ